MVNHKANAERIKIMVTNIGVVAKAAECQNEKNHV
jgi:hypothetical protein